MNRRGIRVWVYYGCALIAGMPIDSARRMLPGFLMDMYRIRERYDRAHRGL